MSLASSTRPSIGHARGPPIDSDCAQTSGSLDAIYFDSGEYRLFGWLQTPPRHAMANVGLVICKPFGYEAICSHRALRAFGESAVALGMPTLRVDYAGTGDSAEIDPEADQLTVWTRDVAAAVLELRRRTGVQKVCLLGVRLGALLATLAAGECAAVTALILIAPIVKGRRHVRELRTTRLAASMASAQLAGGAPSVDTAGVGAGAMEVSGFLFSAATLAALASVDLTARAAPTVSDALVIDGASMPGSGPWAQQLAGLGVRTKYLALPGLIEMIMTAPQFAAIPQEMVAASRDWLREILRAPPAPSAGDSGQHSEGGAAPSNAVMTLREDGSAQSAPLTERPVFLGSEAQLFGIVTEPRLGEIRRRGVILLNAGADYHIGANGMHVDLARHWARRGYVALRMDLAGLGDSGTRPGQPDDEVFPAAVLDDIRTAVDFLRQRYGVRDVTLFGLCSGAYHALRAAAAGVPVNRILMVNPQNYFWKEGTTLDDLQLAEVVHNPGLYRRRIFSGAAWKKLFGGRVDIWRIAKIYFYRPLLALESSLRDMARRTHIRLPNDLGRELEEIHTREVRIVFVFARGEPGIDLLKIEGGSSVKRLGESCRIHIIDGADHIFSQSGPRAIMKKMLSDELFAASS